MSHVATAWAVGVRGISAGEFRVLLCLADCHNPDKGCFPSQSYLAEACEMSRSSVNANLSKLEEKALIQRHARGNRHMGGRSSTHYILCLDGGLSPETGHKVKSGEPDTRGGLSPEIDQVKSGEPDTEPVKEPVRSKEPVIPEQKKLPKIVDGDFDEFWEACPRKVAKGRARTAYAKALKKTDHQTILDGMRRYARDREGKDATYTAHPASWLNDERWTDTEAPRQPDFHDKVSAALEGQDDDRLRDTDQIGHQQVERLPAPVSAAGPDGRGNPPGPAPGDGRGGEQSHFGFVRPRRFGGSG